VANLHQPSGLLERIRIKQWLGYFQEMTNHEELLLDIVASLSQAKQ